MQSAETLANLQKFLTLLDPALNRNEMLTNVARQLVEMFEVDHSGMMIWGDKTNEGKVLAEYPNQSAVGLKVPLKNYPLHTQLMQDQLPIAVQDAQNDPIMGDVQATMQSLGIQSILIIPLVVRQQVIGSLSLDAIQQPRLFTQDEIDLCQVIGKQIAVAIDYTEAREAVEANHAQNQALHETNRVLNASLNLDNVLDLILVHLEDVMPVDGISIYLLVEGGIQLKAWRGQYTPFQDQSVLALDNLWGAAEIVKTKSPLLVSNVHEHPDWDVYEGSPIRSWLGTPLIVRDEVVGVLNLDGYEADKFKERHIQLAQTFANQAATAIRNAHLYSEATKRAYVLASMQEIGVSIIESLDIENVLQAIAQNAIQLFEAQHARIYLYLAETDTFSLATSVDALGQIETIAPPRKEGLTASVARTGHYIAIPNISEHPLYQDRKHHGFKAIVGLPLKKQDNVLGVLTVFYEKIHPFPSDEIELLHLLGTQAAVALENARLYSAEQTQLQDQERRTSQWRKIQKITSTLNKSLDLDEVLNNACEQIMQLIDVGHCGIMLYNDDQRSGRVVAEYPATGAMGVEIPNHPIIHPVIEAKQPFISTNTAEDTRLGDSAVTLQALGIQAILIVPLIVQDQVIGTIGLDILDQPRAVTDEEIKLTQIAADQIAIAITNAHTYQAEREARIQADTLREVAAILGGTLDLNEVFVRILAQLARVIPSDSSSIILRQEDQFEIVAARGFPDVDEVIGLTFNEQDQIYLRVIKATGQPVIISDTSQVEWWQSGPTHIKSWMAAPMFASDRLMGVLTVDHLEPNFYTETHAKLVTTFADLAAIALANARLYELEVKQVEQELMIAREIQQGFLPKTIPNFPGWEIAAICLPAHETGGDFYEFIERPDEQLGVVVGDVSGKSIRAAMIMADAHSVVRAKGSDYRSPAAVLSQTNHLLYDDMPKGAFVAVSYALLSPGSDTICFSNGGQLAPFLVPANTTQPIHLIETPGNHLPLGIVTNLDYQEMTLPLRPGDSLVFYTDGLIEQQDEAGNMLGFEEVYSLLGKLRGQPPTVILSSLVKAVQDFADGIGPHDDITLVVAQYQGV
ncbi:MAG: GAF domain-containing protein [Chloroflexota bacterium]